MQFVLLIDEINRGDIPRIFGELLMLLEVDKRGQSVLLPVSGRRIQGSEERLDHRNNEHSRPFDSVARYGAQAAIRIRGADARHFSTRRYSCGRQYPSWTWLAALNDRIREYIGRDARNLQIGHSYLMQGGRPISGLREFVQVLSEDIVPLLEEYCYEDYAKTGKNPRSGAGRHT